MVYALGEQLELMSKEEVLERNIPAVFLTTTRECRMVLEEVGIVFEGEIELVDDLCKVETQQECIYGAFAIPKLLDVLGSRYKLLIFVNQNYIVIADDDDFSERLVKRIQRRKIHQGDTKEKFLYNFMTEFMNRDIVLLGKYERQIIELEDDVMHEKVEEFQNRLMPLRRELLTLRSYYDELSDAAKELEDNENGFFAKKQLKYFGTIADRAERLMGKTAHLLEYAQQVKDAHQTQIDAKQNANMQYLTMISTIFFPLTLITGWYGMNFEDMPGLNDGYPFVVFLSIAVIMVSVLLFKKKKIF